MNPNRSRVGWNFGAKLHIVNGMSIRLPLRRRASLPSAIALAMVAMAPVLAAGTVSSATRGISQAPSAVGALGAFTPSSPDPVLAALLTASPESRRLATTTLRFTPKGGQTAPATLTVATHARPVDLRANLSVATSTAKRAIVAQTATPSTLAVRPSTYDLGESVGWKSFSQRGAVAQVDRALTREPLAAPAEQSAGRSRFGGTMTVEPAAPVVETSRALADRSVELDVAGSYRLSRSIDVKAGVRYRVDRDRLDPDVQSGPDSSALYVGTAFKF